MQSSGRPLVWGAFTHLGSTSAASGVGPGDCAASHTPCAQPRCGFSIYATSIGRHAVEARFFWRMNREGGGGVGRGLQDYEGSSKLFDMVREWTREECRRDGRRDTLDDVTGDRIFIILFPSHPLPRLPSNPESFPVYGKPREGRGEGVVIFERERWLPLLRVTTGDGGGGGG